MTSPNDTSTTFEEQWDILLNALSKTFGHPVDFTAALFLVGIQEAGTGFRDYTKEEKWRLIHIAGCKALSYFGYYQPAGTDTHGLPAWEENQHKPAIDDEQRERLIKKGLLRYFREMDFAAL